MSDRFRSVEPQPSSSGQELLFLASGDGVRAGITTLVGDDYTDQLRHEIDEFVLVLEGHIDAHVDGERQVVGPGEHFRIPAGAWHDFAHVGLGWARMLFVFPTGSYPITDSVARCTDSHLSIGGYEI